MNMSNTPQQPPPLRVGLVGCGNIAKHHIRGLSQCQRADGSPRAVFGAFADPCMARRQAAAELAAACGLKGEGCVAGATLGEIPASGAGAVDAVLLCVPHDLHEPLCIEALGRGPVILEKPIAPTVAAARRILEAAAESGHALFVAENSAFWAEVVTAKELIDKGCIGDVVSVAAHYYESLAATPFGGSDADAAAMDPYNLGWRGSLKRCGGGITIDGGLHWLRPARMLGGAIDAVVMSAARPFSKVWPPMEGESLSRALLRYRDGEVQGSFGATFMAKTHMSKAEPWFRVIGTEGEIVIFADFEAGGMELFNSRHPDGVAPPLSRRGFRTSGGAAGGFLGSFARQWYDICHCLETGAKQSAVSPPEEALVDVAVVACMYKSLLSERWETVRVGACDCGGQEEVPAAARAITLCIQTAVLDM
eukprot:g900.t1